MIPIASLIDAKSDLIERISNDNYASREDADSFDNKLGKKVKGVLKS